MPKRLKSLCWTFTLSGCYDPNQLTRIIDNVIFAAYYTDAVGIHGYAKFKSARIPPRRLFRDLSPSWIPVYFYFYDQWAATHDVTIVCGDIPQPKIKPSIIKKKKMLQPLLGVIKLNSSSLKNVRDFAPDTDTDLRPVPSTITVIHLMPDGTYSAGVTQEYIPKSQQVTFN